MRQLSSYLAAKVATQRYYRLVPRDVLQAEFARRRRTSYRACYQKRCQVEIGQALAADSVLATKVLRVGNRCAISAMLYDLRTEATERAALVRTACAEVALLTGIDRTAKQLAMP